MQVVGPAARQRLPRQGHRQVNQAPVPRGGAYGQVAAVGTLTGTVTNAAGQTIGAIVQTLTLSLININATCDILHLELGPIDLNLLGLVVHVDKIVVDIDAQSGPGNLLGNLLCAIANLLNNNGPVATLVSLLNQILGLL